MPRNERLRQQRFERNWRQSDVADQLGVSLLTVQRWERGTQQPSLYYRAKLCALFGLSPQELGLEDLTPLPSSFPENHTSEAEPSSETSSANTELWTVAYRRNPHFTGRDEVLDRLMQQLAPGASGQSTPMRLTALTQAQALTGLGGIGKTQIAVEYAYRARAQGRYRSILWINAASEEALLTSFASLAEQLPTLASQSQTDQRQLVRVIIEWLEQCEEPWLLIFDNADDLSLLPAYLPRRGNGSVLLTTRASAVGTLARSIEVETMGVLEGTRFLLHRAQRQANASEEEINEASHLVVALGQFPLALDQAGAYLEETGCSVRDYLHLYQQHRQALLARRGKQALGYPEAVGTTWSLSFERVAQANPAATDLLRLCALLSADHIPEELLIEGRAYWPTSLQQAVTDPLRFNQMLADLLRFSLVKRLSEDHLLSIHRLVQVVQMETMGPQEQRRWAERVVRAVNSLFPRDPQDPAAAWPRCQRYLDQAQACDLLIQQHQLLLPEAADLLDRTGTYLRERALYVLAGPLYQRALHIREQQLGPEHLETAQTLYNLANLFWRQGKYEEAEPLFQRVLRIREQQLGSEHPNTAAALNELAILYYEQGKYAQTERLFQQALHIREQQVGPEHPNTAETLNNLASLYYQQGKYEEAEPLFQRALRIREQQLGPEHPDMASSLNNLANLYRNQGKYEQAEPLYHQALRIREQQLGPEHPEVAWPLLGLANLYSQQGRYEEAEPLFQQVLSIWKQQLGSKHPDMAYPLHGLALLYEKQKKEKEAESLFLRVLGIREQQLGPEHLGTAAVLHDFASFQQARGKMPEANLLYQRALTIRKHVLGPDHPLTIQTCKQLHEVLLMLGRTEEAEALLASRD